MKKISILLIVLNNCAFAQLPVVLQNNTTAVSITSSGIISNHTSNRLASQNNIVFGNNALNVGVGANANNNITLGHDAMRQGVGAGSNIAIGNNSQYFSSYNLRNISIGYNTLYGMSPMSGDGNAYLDNIAIGYQALQTVFPFTSDNVAIGTNTLRVGGSGSVAIGSQSLSGGLSLGTVAIGHESLKSGSSNSVSIGQRAGFSTTSQSGNIFLGYQAGYSETTSNKLYIENSNSATPLIGGDFANDKLGINRLITDLATRTENLQVTGNAYISGNLVVNTTTYTSDLRYKKNIKTLENPLFAINQIRGTRYDFDTVKFPELPSKPQIGLIAQEVEKVYPELVNTDANGFKSVDYARVSAILIEAVKELNKNIKNQEKTIEKLTAEYSTLKSMILKSDKNESVSTK